MSSEMTNKHDLTEYAALWFLAKALPSIQSQQEDALRPSDIQRLRDNWLRDGVPFDTDTMNPKASDFANLLRGTGATSFGDLDKFDSLEDAVKANWGPMRDGFLKAREAGQFIHTITDPYVRREVLANPEIAGTAFSKAYFIHQGTSLREVEPGKPVTLTTREGVAAGTFTKSAQDAVGFATNELTPAPGQSSALPANDDLSDDRYYGWNGTTLADGEEIKGLKDVLGPYLSKADNAMIAKNIDNQYFDGEIVQNSVQLLQHMRGNGYSFKVREDDQRNRIEVQLSAGANLNVRIFDNEQNGKFIGRTYDSFNAYYFNVTSTQGQRDTTFSAEDSIALLEYVTGKRNGTVKKFVSKDSSSVQLEGISRIKSVQVNPLPNRYRALTFVTPEEAQEHLETSIASAQQFVDDTFRVDDLQAKIDEGLDDENILVSSNEFKSELEALYAEDIFVRAAQETAVQAMLHSRDGGREHLAQAAQDIVGTYEDGFDPTFVETHMEASGRGHERDALLAAMKTVGYDETKLKGNAFALQMARERLVEFDPETAKTKDQLDHPFLIAAVETVEEKLEKGGFRNRSVAIDDKGVIHWEGDRKTASKSNDIKKQYQSISGNIGQVLVPDEYGVIKTKFNHDENYGVVPGFTGYFAFEGDYENRMNRFRVKGFEQHMKEQVGAMVTHQMTRPYNWQTENIATTLDGAALNGLYHGDVYGKRVDLDFLETSQLNTETKEAILATLASRVRFDNQFSDYATTAAETQAKRDGVNPDEFSYLQVAGGENMRVLAKDAENYADMTMTGTNKTQGLIWYLTEGAEVNPDGSVTPSKGWEKDGKLVPDTAALQKLEYFDNKAFSAWDRNQMSSNQLLTALRVDEKVNTALMAFGGWTFDDSYAVSKEFADRNQVFGAKPNENSMDRLHNTLEILRDNERVTKEEVLAGSGMMWSQSVIDQGQELLAGDSDEAYEAFLEEHGRFRPLQRGDKLSDFGGNKGTIGIVIDRRMSPEDAKAQQLDKEVAFMAANPSLDVISAPYSMLSRHNAGVVKELMSGDVQDLIDPETGEKLEGAMGQLNIIVTDMKVDKKTHAYSQQDVLEGKGRKASGQLAWALQSKDAGGMLDEIYGNNDNAWSTYREYLIATGLDMKADGTIVEGYTPHAGEERNTLAWDENLSHDEFLAQIKHEGGFLETPFPLKFKTGQETTEVPVLSASLRQNVELIDGSLRRSDFTNQYAQMYKEIGNYHEQVGLQELARVDIDGAENAEAKKAAETALQKALEGEERAKQRTQDQFDKLQSTIIERQFDGGHNGKHSYIRDNIMGKRMQKSATGVAIVDPRLNIGEMGMNQEMLDSLGAKEGDLVAGFRDPVWRDGAIRAFTVKLDESVHGVSINPIADKSHDMDFDGDTMGLIKFESKEALKDLREKFSHSANMIDLGTGKPDDLYFQSGMDLASAEAKAKKLGDDRPEKLYAKVLANASSPEVRKQKVAVKALNDYSHVLFREHGFASDYVSLTSDEKAFASFEKMVKNGAKGNDKKLEDYQEYHLGKKTEKDARDIQYATGVKSDDTGLAGAFSQKLVSTMRNKDIKGALEAMYPLTQGTLQIKHDAKHAVVVNEILTEDMNLLFRGRSTNKDVKGTLTPNQFKTELTDLMTNKMKVDVNPTYIEAVAETMTVGGKIVPLKEAMQLKASPMDLVAYGGGYEALQDLAEKGKSLLTGKQNERFAPFSMREATESTVIAKKDTQRKKEAVNEAAVEADTVKAREIAATVTDDGPEL